MPDGTAMARSCSPSLLEPLNSRLAEAVRRRPGQTASALATGVLGTEARASRVQFTLTLLELRGLIVRIGAGGRADPFRYIPTCDGQRG
jgi:hypothetical protein